MKNRFSPLCSTVLYCKHAFIVSGRLRIFIRHLWLIHQFGEENVTSIIFLPDILFECCFILFTWFVNVISLTKATNAVYDIIIGEV